MSGNYQAKMLERALAALLRRAGGSVTLGHIELEDVDGEVILMNVDDNGNLEMVLIPPFVKHALNSPADSVPTIKPGKHEYTLEFDATKWTASPLKDGGGGRGQGKTGGGRIMPDAVASDFYNTQVQPYQQILAKQIMDQFLPGSTQVSVKPDKKPKKKKGA